MPAFTLCLAFAIWSANGQGAIVWLHDFDVHALNEFAEPVDGCFAQKEF
jgi:hypothetical protein